MKPNPSQGPSSFLTKSLLTTRSEAEDYFQRWVGTSAWLLLVMYDGASLGDDGLSECGWSRWHLGDRMSHSELRVFLESEIFPDLERLEGSGHPLAQVPAALRGVPDGPLMSTLQRAKDCHDPSSLVPLSEISQIWERWKDAVLPNMEGGEGMIPYSLADFLSKSLAVRTEESVADLYARTGSVGGEIFDYTDSIKKLVLYEPSPELSVIAAMQAILSGQSPSNLRVFADYPFNSQKHDPKFDVVVAVPPWGLSLSETGSTHRKIRSELLFLEHAMDVLAEGGRAAIVVPHSFLSAGFAKRVRQRLIETFRVDAVVYLPSQAGVGFSAKSAILYFSKAPPREDVWIVSESEYNELIEEGDYDVSNEESLITAIQARQGLAPDRKINGRTIDFITWIHELMLDIADPGPMGIHDHLLSYKMAALAQQFFYEFIDETLPFNESKFANLISRNEIIRRGFELLPLRGSLLETEQFLSIAAERHGARVVSLQQIAEIRRGRRWRADEIVKQWAFLEEHVSLVRPADLPKTFNKSPVLSHGSVRLTTEAALSVKEADLLIEDDVLFCLIGDTGKVSLSSPDIFMAKVPKVVASDRVAVIRIRDEFKSEISAYFLAALLASLPYREEFLARSTGSTIRQISVREIGDIRVPLFPLVGQMLLMSKLGDDSVSLDSLIEALESRPKSNEAIRCFSDAPEWRSFSELPLDAPPAEVRAALAQLVATRGTQIIDQCHEAEDSFLPWMKLFVEAARDLEQILSYPPGTDQLAALYGWRSSVRDANRPFRTAWNHFVNTLNQDSENIRKTVRHRCDKLFARVSSLSIMAGDALLDHIELNATINPQSVPANFQSEVAITIVNSGPLPLRKLYLRGDGIEDRVIPILPSGSAHSWKVIFGSLQPGRHIVHVVWNALRLDERPVGGEMELAIDVSDSSERTGLLDLGESPYVYARVLDEKTENVFFGRSSAIQQIRSAISRHSASTIVLVEGNRRIGKTSLLKFFIRHYLPSDKVPVFINFQEFDGESGSTARPGIPTRKVFEGMAKELVDSAMRAFPGLELPELGKAPEGNPFRMKVYSAAATSLIDPEAPFASFRQLAEIIRIQIQPKSLLLIFDEFDRLQEGIESGITSDQVPENLRHLFQSWNDVSGIFTGSRTIRRLRQDYWNILFGLGETVRLSGLDLDEARGLIVEPVKGRLVFAPKAVDEICRLTARQPLIIQGICERIFRECSKSGRRSIDFSMVETIASKFAEENEHFESIWSYVGSDRKRLITFLIDQQEATTGGATFEQLQDLLEECRLRISVRELHGDLEDLEDLEVIGKQQQTGIARYRIEIPLFARWLRMTKDFSEFRAAAQEE